MKRPRICPNFGFVSALKLWERKIRMSKVDKTFNFTSGDTMFEHKPGFQSSTTGFRRILGRKLESREEFTAPVSKYSNQRGRSR